ncbi:hypothetical protein ACJX0J_006612, partial [Zea mays]
MLVHLLSKIISEFYIVPGCELYEFRANNKIIKIKYFLSHEQYLSFFAVHRTT